MAKKLKLSEFFAKKFSKLNKKEEILWPYRDSLPKWRCFCQAGAETPETNKSITKTVQNSLKKFVKYSREFCGKTLNNCQLSPKRSMDRRFWPLPPPDLCPKKAWINCWPGSFKEGALIMKSYIKVFKELTLGHASFPLKVIIFWNPFPCVWYHHDGLIFSPLFIIIHRRHAHSAGAERAKKMC